MSLIYAQQDRVKWRAVNIVNEFSHSIKGEEFLDNLGGY